MALTPDEQKTLDALVAKSKEDEDEEFEIEIWSGQDGARVPYKRGKAWFEKTFGVDLGGTDDKQPTTGRKRPTAKQDASKSDDDGGQEPPEGVLRHFGTRRNAAS